MNWTPVLLLVLMAGVVAPVLAASDREVVEAMVLRSGDVCPGHSVERTTPTIKAVPVGALRVILIVVW